MCIRDSLNVVATQPGQILHKHGGGLAGGKLLHHVVETGAVHRDAGDTIVQEVDQVGVSFFLRHLGQQFLLVADAVTLALQEMCIRDRVGTCGSPTNAPSLKCGAHSI